MDLISLNKINLISNDEIFKGFKSNTIRSFIDADINLFLNEGFDESLTYFIRISSLVPSEEEANDFKDFIKKVVKGFDEQELIILVLSTNLDSKLNLELNNSIILENISTKLEYGKTLLDDIGFIDVSCLHDFVSRKVFAYGNDMGFKYSFEIYKFHEYEKRNQNDN